MARTVNMRDAKNNLSRLVAQVEQGEEIVLARRGEPVARLVGFANLSRPTLSSDSQPLFSPELLEDWDNSDAAILELFGEHLPGN